MADLLEARGLHKTFGDTVAVNGVDMHVAAGERVALVGPNGAGKTTTLLMLLGAIEPDGGSVEIAGVPLTTDRAAAMARLGFAAGYLPLPRYLSVVETLEFFATLQGLAKPRTAALGLAKAIIHNPELLVLDEPTASLDPEVAHRVRQGLLRLNEEQGTAILFTSHDMREVELLAQRLVFLARGDVLHAGPPADVVAQSGDADLEALFLRVAGIGHGASDIEVSD